MASSWAAVNSSSYSFTIPAIFWPAGCALGSAAQCPVSLPRYECLNGVCCELFHFHSHSIQSNRPRSQAFAPTASGSEFAIRLAHNFSSRPSTQQPMASVLIPPQIASSTLATVDLAVTGGPSPFAQSFFSTSIPFAQMHASSLSRNVWLLQCRRQCWHWRTVDTHQWRWVGRERSRGLRKCCGWHLAKH